MVFKSVLAQMVHLFAQSLRYLSSAKIMQHIRAIISICMQFVSTHMFTTRINSVLTFSVCGIGISSFCALCFYQASASFDPADAYPGHSVHAHLRADHQSRYDAAHSTHRHRDDRRLHVPPRRRYR